MAVDSEVYPAGSAPTFTFSVRNEDGDLVDVDDLLVRVRDSDGVSTDHEDAVRVSLGTYELQVVIPEDAEDGTWSVWARSTTPIRASSLPIRFVVRSA